MFAVALTHYRLSAVAQEEARQRRLNARVRTLFHQTSKQNADAIMKQQRMLPGSCGVAGGGMYCAEKAADTDHKATNRGVVLKADVRLGRTKTVSENGACFTTFHSLRREGYDSVLIPRHNGREFVVYHPDQVTNVRLHALRHVQVHVQWPGHINF